MLRLLPFLFLGLLTSSASADQTGEYVGINPWNRAYPDCDVSGGPSVGLGGACFTVPARAVQFRVTLYDDVLGPGFGALNLCDEVGCSVRPICGGVAEGVVPAGATYATVAAYDPAMAWTLCGVAGLTWAPTHGVITLTFATEP